MSAVQVDPSISKVPIETNAKDQATVCVLCSHNCGLTVDINDGHIENIRADAASPISHGYICNKGFSVDHYVNHAQRLSHPLKRKPDGGFEPIGWDQAIAEIAERLTTIIAQHSPRACGVVGIGGQANHLDGAVWRHVSVVDEIPSFFQFAGPGEKASTGWSKNGCWTARPAPCCIPTTIMPIFCWSWAPTPTSAIAAITPPTL